MNDEDYVMYCPWCESEQTLPQCNMGTWAGQLVCRCRFCGGQWKMPLPEVEEIS